MKSEKIKENNVELENVTEISYRRVQNLGNYETETIEVKVSVPADEDPEDVFDNMKKWAKYQLNK